MATANTADAGVHARHAGITPTNVELSELWSLFVLRGGLATIFGIVALLFPMATILSLVVLFGAFVLVESGATLYSAFQRARRREKWGPLAALSFLYLSVAAAALLWPGLTALAFLFIFAAWTLLTGCVLLAGAYRVDRKHGRWWLAFSGVISILFTAIAVLSPVLGFFVLAGWIGAYSLVLGVTLLVLGFKLRGQHRTQPNEHRNTAAAV